jgi:hypothetical protein
MSLAAIHAYRNAGSTFVASAVRSHRPADVPRGTLLPDAESRKNLAEKIVRRELSSNDRQMTLHKAQFFGQYLWAPRFR